jgi:hypothetical protein
MYTISFYLMLIFYIYRGITGNIDMQHKAFQGTVILGFFNIFNNFNRR